MTDRTAPIPRPATAADLPGVGAVLGRAFADDELIAWFQPDPELRHRLLAGLFGHLSQTIPVGHGTEVTVAAGRITGAAVWAPPGRWKPSLVRQLRALPRLLLDAGPANLSALSERGAPADRAFGAAHPSRPHWYLAALGVHPDAHGTGAGSALVRSGVRRAEREGVAAYLECLPRLVPFYERHGFRVIHRVDLPAGAPEELGMLWTPS